MAQRLLHLRVKVCTAFKHIYIFYIYYSFYIYYFYKQNVGKKICEKIHK